ncbi:MAG: response regulator [Balneolaceae bacterium]|nr:MAG: response regulator [Balneolaceae bacterium]
MYFIPKKMNYIISYKKQGIKINGFVKKYSILIVDDENMTHVILKALLHDEYNLYFANNAQEAIDILSVKVINLILLDVQMPQVTGIELLESLMIDSVLRCIPTIIITGKATEEIEARAKEIGAAHFISKDILFTKRDYILNQIRRKLITEPKKPETFKGYKDSLRNIIKSLLSVSVSGDLITASRKLGAGLILTFEINYLSVWTVYRGKSNLILSLGDKQPENFGPEQIINEPAFQKFLATKKPYLTNNPASENEGMFANLSQKIGLSSEIAVPFYKISKDQLLHNNMVIPPATPIFGFIVLKRNRVFTTKEFNILSKFLIQAGTILYVHYQKMFVQNG